MAMTVRGSNPPAPPSATPASSASAIAPVPRQARSAQRDVLILIAATFLARVAFASSLGLGIDESYTVATARHLQLSEFDHPPAAWWLVWGASRLFATEHALPLRLPFIALFALTTWLMFRLTTRLFGEKAGLWAATTLNFAPVLAWTSGTWILPDGPLNAALVAGANAAAAALFGARSAAPRWWLAMGACAGLALLSKFHGAFLLAGVGLFLVTVPSHRRWLATPWPYAALLVATAVCLPVIVWNAQHNWMALAFQGGRVQFRGIDPWGPLAALGGQALYLLPWLWLPLVVCLVKAAVRGRADDRRWMIACLAIGPIFAFVVVGLSGTRVLYHWAAPGYLMLFPLLGDEVAAAIANHSRYVRPWLIATTASIAVVLATVVLMAELPMPAIALPSGKSVPYPLWESLDWNDLATELEARGLLATPKLFITATRWHEAGKIDYALGGRVPVMCLCRDPRAYGVLTRPDAHLGENALIVGRALSLERAAAEYGAYFETIAEMPPIAITHAGRPAFELSIYLGYGLRASTGTPNLLDPLSLRSARR
jgi:4-amino-4-deoxy-L-arabinose transferase-like glycosyltransferase